MFLNNRRAYASAMPLHPSPIPAASDPVAAAVAEHLQHMEAAGHGEFSIGREGDQFVLAFDQVEVRAKSYDVALLRLASAMLDSLEFCSLFLARMRNHACNPPAANSRDNLLGVRQAAGRR